MKTLSIDQLRKQASNVSAVSLTADGGGFYLRVTVNDDILTVGKRHSREPRLFTNPLIAFQVLRDAGLKAGSFEMSEWAPEQAKPIRQRPDRAKAMALSKEAQEHESWMLEAASEMSAIADSPNAKWRSQDEAEQSWQTKRKALQGKLEKAA